MNRYQQIIGRINYGLFLAIIALLPAPQIVLRYTIVAWGILWFLEGRWLNRANFKIGVASYRLWIPFVLFGLWYGWKVVSWFWSADHIAWGWQIERYLTFALIIPIGLWGLNECYDWRTAGKVLVAGCVIAVPLYISYMAALYFHPEWVPDRCLNNEWTQHTDWWLFFSENISHFKHRLFLCSVEIFGSILAFLLYRKKLWVLLPIWAVMLMTIPLTGSRQSVITTLALFIVGVIALIPKDRRWRYGIAIALVGIVASIGILHWHPRMQDIEVSDIKEMRERSYYHDVRLNIWGTALQHPQDYLAYGLGAGQSCNYLKEKFQNIHFDGYVAKQYHAHCQYLEETMEIGLPGLLLFLLAWLSIPICAPKKGRLIALLFTTLFVFNMFTDCMFGKFDGVALWAAGLLFILLQSDPQREEQPSGNTERH